MSKRLLRDDLFAFRGAHAIKLETRFMDLLEKSGLTLDRRGTADAIRCMGWRMSDGRNEPMLAVTAKNPQELTLISSIPFEEGQHLILKRSDREGKDRFVEGIIQHSRRGARPDDDNVFISTLKITRGHF